MEEEEEGDGDGDDNVEEDDNGEGEEAVEEDKGGEADAVDVATVEIDDDGIGFVGNETRDGFSGCVFCDEVALADVVDVEVTDCKAKEDMVTKYIDWRLLSMLQWVPTKQCELR